MHLHFEQKDAMGHVVEKKAKGILALAESHATEMPGHISAGADSAKDTAVFLLLLWLLQSSFATAGHLNLFVLLSLCAGWVAWKTARSAVLAWARLERLHKIIEEERHEIEHNRAQEREELRVLYRAKGFQGKLLEEVLDVLMSDQDRLLKVMLEEELGLALETYEHPLKQSLGAFAGSFLACAFSIGLFCLLPSHGMPIASLSVLALSSAAAARYEKNEWIPAMVWNLAVAALSYGIAYFFLRIYLQTAN